jgi:adenylate cyclase
MTGMTRIGIRLATTGLVLASIIVTAGAVHALWWRTAQANSRQLASTINAQIVSAVEKEIASIDTQARSAFSSIRTLFFQNVLDTREADKREFVFLSQLQAQPTVSWIAFGWPDGSFFAAHKLGDLRLEMVEIAPKDGVPTKRVDSYNVVVGDIEFQQRSFEPATYKVIDQDWYRASIGHDEPAWFDVPTHPNGVHPAIGFAGPIDVYSQRQGVLAVVIDHSRLRRFLADLAVGKSGAAFIFGSHGSLIAAPDPQADEVTGSSLTEHPLLNVARLALGTASMANSAGMHEMRQLASGVAYDVTLTPLAFPGWMLATAIPEEEFLGQVDAATRRLVLGLAALVVVAGLLSAWLARALIAAPLVRVAGELKHVEKFELDRVRRHPSRLAEIDGLSATIADMAKGLASFGKYLPPDVVKVLATQGVEARPGGSIRQMTVLFIDIAGFTGLSERLGGGIVPVLGAYFDAMSREVGAHNGTIDKFIGDGVMAFWGAPAPNADHAVDACRAALACQRAVRDAGIADDSGRPLRIRIGINSGDMLVGNIGSELRLSYTVIGDAVNIASRLEGANKQYGTDIIIGEETRALAGARIHVRELDGLAVYGRAAGLRVFELIGMAEDGSLPEPFVALYESGLAAYRAREFTAALTCFQKVLNMRVHDEPSTMLIERCRRLIASPPADDWQPIERMEAK